MSEEKRLLLDIIQHYPFLYDKKQKEYKDVFKKAQAWTAVATALQITVEVVQREWKNLREKYSKVRKIRSKQPSGSEAMSFMAPHISTRKRVTNVPYKHSNDSAWNTFEHLVQNDSEMEPNKSTSSATTIAQTNFEEAGPSSKADASPTYIDHATKKSTVKQNIEMEVEETLTSINSFLKDKQKPDKNCAFGQYVGLSLADMPTPEQNFKKLKIVENINEPFP